MINFDVHVDLIMTTNLSENMIKKKPQMTTMTFFKPVG